MSKQHKQQFVSVHLKHPFIQFKLDLWSIYKATVDFYVCIVEPLKLSDISHVSCKLMNLTNKSPQMKEIRAFNGLPSLNAAAYDKWYKFRFEFDFQTNIFDLIFNSKSKYNSYKFNYLNKYNCNNCLNKCNYVFNDHVAHALHFKLVIDGMVICNSNDAWLKTNTIRWLNSVKFQILGEFVTRDRYADIIPLFNAWTANYTEFVIDYKQNKYHSLANIHGKFLWYLKVKEIIRECVNDVSSDPGWIIMILFKYINLWNIPFENYSELDSYCYYNNYINYVDVSHKWSNENNNENKNTNTNKNKNEIEDRMDNNYYYNDIVDFKQSKNKYKSSLIKKKITQNRKMAKLRKLQKSQKNRNTKKYNKNRRRTRQRPKYKEKYPTKCENDDYFDVYVNEPYREWMKQFELQSDIEPECPNCGYTLEAGFFCDYCWILRQEELRRIEEIHRLEIELHRLEIEIEKLCNISNEYNAEYDRKYTKNQYNSMIVKKKYQRKRKIFTKHEKRSKKIEKQQIKKIYKKNKKFNKQLMCQLLLDC